MESQMIARAKSRDPEALAQLLVDLAPITRATIRRIQPYATDPDNLYGEANLILLDALEDFDPDRGVPFHLFYRKRLSYFLMDDLKRSVKEATVPPSLRKWKALSPTWRTRRRILFSWSGRRRCIKSSMICPTESGRW